MSPRTKPKHGSKTGIRIFLRRQRREITVPLRAPAIVGALAVAGRQPSRSGWSAKFRIRLHEDGRVRCRIRTYSRYNTPPYFRGRLHESAGGVVLRGVIRESRKESLVTVMFTTLTVFMAAIAVVCAASHPIVVPGLVICSVAAVAFGVLSVMLRAARESSFPREADELEARICQQFDAAPSEVAHDERVDDGVE